MRAYQYRQQAEECRMTAGLLIGFAIACAFATGCLWYSLGAGIGFLSGLLCTLVSAGGAWNELMDARHKERLARHLQPLSYERRDDP